MNKFSVIIKRVAICVIALLTISVAANAQEKGDIAAGINLGLGIGGGAISTGAGAKVMYSVTSPIRVEGSFNYFRSSLFPTLWDGNINAHYLLRPQKRFSLYPIVGVCIVGSKIDDTNNIFDDISDIVGETGGEDETGTTLGFGGNIGAGFDVKISKKLVFDYQLKYMIVSGEIGGRLVSSVGLAFKF